MYRFRKALALALALCLVFTAGAACAGGLGDFVSYYLDINTDVRFSAGVQIKTWMPFSDATTEMLNNVLKHISLVADIQTRDGGSDTTVAMAADGESLFTLSESEGENGAELTTSLLPNRTLTSQGSVLNALFDDKADETAFDALNALSEVKTCYKALTDAIIPYAEEKAASYKIKNIGTARWGRVAKLTQEQSALLLPQIIAVLSCGMDTDFRAELAQMTCQKNFAVALYRGAADGKDMAVYMKGNVVLADGATRSLSYQWACVDSGTERKDTYKFELKKTKSPADSRIVAASYTQKKFTDRFTLDGKCETTLKNPERTLATTVKHDLKGTESGNVRTYAGTQSTAEKTTADGNAETVTTTLTQDMKLTSAEGSGILSGTVRLQKLNAKRELADMTVTFDEAPAQRLDAAADSGELYAVGGDAVVVTIIDPESGVVQTAPTNERDKAAAQYEVGKAPVGYASFTAPQEAQQASVDGISNAQMKTLTDEMAQNLAGKLLLALAKLPEEDRALLSDGMTDEDFQSFMELVNSL